MRDIRFRGLTDKGTWVYGNVVYSKDAVEGWEAIIIPQENSNMYSSDETLDDPILEFERWYRVDVNTVGHYTGLEDKNGVEIYEGDVIQELKVNWEVVFYRSAWRLGRNVKGDMQYKSLDRYTYRCEIIGNIYRNKELLEGK